MWSRLRRRSLAPRRPLLFREQIPLAIVTVGLLVAGVVVVAVLLVARV
jgi:hypothetical protein